MPRLERAVGPDQLLRTVSLPFIRQTKGGRRCTGGASPQWAKRRHTRNNKNGKTSSAFEPSRQFWQLSPGTAPNVDPEGCIAVLERRRPTHGMVSGDGLAYLLGGV